MQENRTYGSEGGEPSNGSLPYPYRKDVTFSASSNYFTKDISKFLLTILSLQTSLKTL